MARVFPSGEPAVAPSKNSSLLRSGKRKRKRDAKKEKERERGQRENEWPNACLSNGDCVFERMNHDFSRIECLSDQGSFHEQLHSLYPCRSIISDARNAGRACTGVCFVRSLRKSMRQPPVEAR